MTAPRLSETPDVEAITEVLVAHDWRWAIRDSRSGDGVRIACTAIGCDWWAERDPEEAEPEDVWAAHRAHVAQALAPVLAAAVREAMAAELREAADDFGPNHGVARWLRDRADRIAGDAPEGGASRG